jgi:hypothetical protein
MKRAVLLWLAVLGGCGSEGAPAPSALPVSGSWSLNQVVQGGSATCGEGGSLVLTQNDASLGGSFSTRGGCDTSGVALDFVRSGNVLAGTLSGTAIRFTLGVCQYSGTVVGNPQAPFGGSVTCTGLPGTTGALLGSWEASR